MGLVAGFQPPIIATYINKRIPSERRATILSVQAVVASGILAAGQPIGGIVADQFGLRAVFLTFGALTLALALPILLLWQRADREEDERAELDRELLGREPVRDAVPAS